MTDSLRGELLVDNWTMHSITSLMEGGPSRDVTVETRIVSGKPTEHAVYECALQLRCLIRFLQDIVLREHLFVDEEWIGVWERGDSPLLQLVGAGVIRPYPRGEIAVEDELKSEILSALISNRQRGYLERSMRARWDSEGSPLLYEEPSRHLGMVYGGAAEYLALSYATGSCLSPHPLRDQVIVGSRYYALTRHDAARIVSDVIQDGRLALFQKLYSHGPNHLAQFSLPGAITGVIGDAENRDSLLRTALDYRTVYDALRLWIQDFQAALDREQTHEVVRSWQSLSSAIQDAMSKLETQRSVEVTGGLGGFSVGTQVRWPHRIKSQLTGIVLSERGVSLLDDLLSMFELGTGPVMHRTREYLLESFSEASKTVP